MPMPLVSITEARERDGLRLVTRRGIPTPWAQAAKSLIEVKGLDCVLAQESAEDPKGAHFDWTGDNGSPFVAYDREPLRDRWTAILELVERLGSGPALIPAGEDRIRFYGLANEICGEMGMAWNLRLLMVEGSLENPDAPGTFPEKVARYLGKKYGYFAGCGSAAQERVRSVLQTLSGQLAEQPYFFGTLSALDVYWAAFGNMFMLLSDEELPAAPLARNAWDQFGGGRFTSEVPDNLVKHHRKMYVEHLGLPVQL